MKRATFALIFLSTHVIFVLMHIHRHTQFVNESFCAQKNERILSQLSAKKQELIAQLCALKSHTSIKQYAHNTLGMRPITLRQIRRLSLHDQHA